MKKIKSNPTLTSLTISIGFLFIYFVGLLKFNTTLYWSLGITVLIGVIGISSNFLSLKVEWLWFKLAGLLSYIVPNILLSIVYFMLLVPLAYLSKAFGKKDPLCIKTSKESMFNTLDKTFDAKSMENPW